MRPRRSSREWARRGSEGEAGFTLVEIMVASSAMLVVAAVFGTVMVQMNKIANREISSENAAGTARSALMQLQRDLEAANPMVGWTSTVTNYQNEIQVKLGPASGTQKTITWSYVTSGSGSSCTGTLWRNVGTSAGAGDPEATGVTNCATSTPVFSFFGIQGDNLLANPASVTSAIITQCSVRIQGALQVSAGPHTVPFSETVSMRLANWEPGTQPCP
ncbi:MAG TPA: type II secretion system protein [Acidimicrobiales bacterium]|nr:type II secretion system protein [Acidimicrobiales bacterium]